MQEGAMVSWRVENRVGHITFNRPEAGNAVNLSFAQAFAATVDEAALAVKQGAVGALLLTARGRQFCVGGDIQAFVARRDDLPALVDEILALVHPAVDRLAALPVPLISAVQGPLGGAGIAMALCADIVLAADTIKLRGGYSAIGLSPDGGASYFVVRRAGAAVAKRIFMRNQNISAQECLRLGLVDELHAPEALADAAERLAQELAQGATGALGAAKRLCDAAAGNDLHRQLALEQQTLLERARSAESREGIGAFIEKRPCRFHERT